MFRFLLFAGRLPEPILYALANVIYWLLCHMFRYRRKTVLNNLQIAFPDRTDAERKHLMQAYYRHLADVAVEIPMLSSMDPARLQKHVTMEGTEHMQALVANKQSFLMLAAHQGNWEWMFASLSCCCPCPMDALYRPIHQSGVDAFFQMIRTRFGSTMLPANNAPKAILRQRKQVRAFCIIADQTPRRRDPMCWIDFLGIRTAVVTGPDRIAQMTGYPSLFVTCERLSRGRYHCVISPLTHSPYDSPETVAHAYMNAVETQIRRQPAYWLWSHRRWRFREMDHSTDSGLP